MFRRVATVCSHVPLAALACHCGSYYAFCVPPTPLPALGDVAATRDSASAVAANQRNNPPNNVVRFRGGMLQNWVTRLPRKQREKNSLPTETSTEPKMPIHGAKRPRTDSFDAAASPPTETEPASDRVKPHGQLIQTMAQRLICGITPAVLSALMDTRVLNVDDHQDIRLHDSVAPRRGLQASCGESEVFILDTFKRRGCAMAHTASIQPCDGGQGWECTLNTLSTVPSSTLGNVGIWFNVVGSSPARLLSQRLSDHSQMDSLVACLRELRACADSANRSKQHGA